MDSLGYSDFKKEAEDALAECKDVAAKKRRQSTRLENLGIPEEELLRQQQELFAKAREAAAKLEQQEQQQLQQQQQGAPPTPSTTTTSESSQPTATGSRTAD